MTTIVAHPVLYALLNPIFIELFADALADLRNALLGMKRHELTLSNTTRTSL